MEQREQQLRSAQREQRQRTALACEKRKVSEEQRQRWKEKEAQWQRELAEQRLKQREKEREALKAKAATQEVQRAIWHQDAQGYMVQKLLSFHGHEATDEAYDIATPGSAKLYMQ